MNLFYHLDNKSYKSIDDLSKRNFLIPIYNIPFSSCHGMILSFTTTIFLKESGILIKGRTSCSLFSSSPMVSANHVVRQKFVFIPFCRKILM